ncbi:hypothetical protein OWM54_28150 [Myxococcus sp. MISCRS1]|nr:hypothetical protein [Myxococcus sp. MISCRS1]
MSLEALALVVLALRRAAVLQPPLTQLRERHRGVGGQLLKPEALPGGLALQLVGVGPGLGLRPRVGAHEPSMVGAIGVAHVPAVVLLVDGRHGVLLIGAGLFPAPLAKRTCSVVPDTDYLASSFTSKPGPNVFGNEAHGGTEVYAGDRPGCDALVHPRGGKVEVGREAAHIPERLPERLLGRGLGMASRIDLGDGRNLLFFGHDVTRAGTSASNDEVPVRPCRDVASRGPTVCSPEASCKEA